MPRTDTATTPARTAHADGSTGRPRITLLLASLGFFLITLDILIVNLALTQIGVELGGGTAGRQWVIDGYTVTFAVLLLFAGNLSDRIGAKRSFGCGIALFLLASIGCAIAPSLGLLIAARVIQGAGAAIMLPASMALIREAFADSRKRTHALGIWAVGGAVAGAVGPLVGGALTTLNWRLVFGINLPVCILMLALLAFVAPSPKRPTPFDWAGQIVAVIALTPLMYGLITGGDQGFGQPSVILALVIAVAGIAGFLLIQGRVHHPMMPLELFRSSGMRIALLDGFVFMIGNFGSVFVVSLYLQQHLGLSPLLAGLVFLPSAAFSITGNIISGTLANRFGPQVPIVLGFTLMAAGFVGLLVTAPSGSPILAGAFLIFTGTGGSIAMPPVTSVVLASVPAQRAGTASAVFNTFRQVGGAVAIAVFGAFIANPATFIPGMQLSFTIAAAALLVAALISLRIRTPQHH